MKNLYTIIHLIICLLPISTLAEDVEYFDIPQEAIPERLGIVDSLVELDQSPDRVSLLVEKGVGVVTEYDAWFIDYDQAVILPKSERMKFTSRFATGAAIDLPTTRKTLNYSFVLSDEELPLAATPVINSSIEAISDNTQLLGDLQLEVVDANKELLEQVSLIEQRELELETLRNKVSKISEVEGIVDLRMQLSELESFNIDDSKILSEQERLSQLISHARTLENPPGLTTLRKDLGEQLKEAAKVSSIAERLDSRKRKAAINRLKYKISLVRSARGVDISALSRQVITLRRKRKEVENKLGLNDTESEAFDF